MTEPAAHPPVRTFKPRRRALSSQRAAVMERLGGRWLLDETGPLLDMTAVFGRRAPVVFDIGIGLGDATIEMAAAQPDVDVIGCDVHTPGIAASLAEIEARELTHVRLVHGDALVFLDRLPARSLAGVRVFFPDPWPKVRQRHRRLVRADTVAALTGRIAPGGWLHLATDVDEYALQMQRVCDAQLELLGGIVERPADRPITRYERRALADGRTVFDFRYEIRA